MMIDDAVDRTGRWARAIPHRCGDAQQRGPGPTVSIVEDQRAIAEVLAEVLADNGFRPVRLAPPYLASQIAASGADVLLLDIVLGHLSGWDILDGVRTDPATRDLPTIITSALYDRPGLHTLPSGGPIVFMSKPFDVYELIDTIDQLINAREADPQFTSADAPERDAR